MREALGEDFMADEASSTSKDELHFDDGEDNL